MIKPAFLLIREKRWKETAVYLGLGIMVIAPWLARTVIISGYLLYPFPALDLFSVDWRIPAGAAALDAAEIKTWGRGLNNAALVDMPITQWFPSWFRNMLPALGKVLILADMMCLVMGVAYAVMTVCRRQWKRLDIILVWVAVAAVAVSFLFWLTSAPLLRYGYAYVLLLVPLTGYRVFAYVRSSFRLNLDQMLCMLLLAAGAAKLWSLGSFITINSQQPYYVNQQDYGKYELDTFLEEGITFYYPVSGDRVGYDAFPAVPRMVDINLLGERLRDGFCDGFWQ